MLRLLLIFISAALLSGCALHPREMKPSYIPPQQYSSLSCEELQTEIMIVDFKVHELYLKLKHEHKMDKYKAGASVLVLIPALFLEGKASQEASEYARLLGLYEALKKNAQEKECNIDITNKDEKLTP